MPSCFKLGLFKTVFSPWLVAIIQERSSFTVHRGKQSPEGQPLSLWEERERERRQEREGEGELLLILYSCFSLLLIFSPLLVMNLIVWFQNDSLKAALSSPQCGDSVLLISKLTHKQIFQVPALPGLTSTWRKKCRPRFQDKFRQSIQKARVSMFRSPFDSMCNSTPLNYIYCVSTICLVIVLVIGFRKLIKHSHWPKELTVSSPQNGSHFLGSPINKTTTSTGPESWGSSA